MSGILNLLLAGAASVIKDAYFNLVTLLLNTTATNGAQNNTFLDSSTNNFSITRNGNTTQGTFTPFSQTGWSNNFNSSGNTDAISFPSNAAYNVGTGNFTVEFWLNPTAFSGNDQRFFLMGVSGTTNLAVEGSAAGALVVTFEGSTVISYSWSPTFSSWYHIAACRVGSTVTLYINGTSVATATSSTSISNNVINVGSLTWAASFNVKGYLSNVRFSANTAFYTANFTPSTTPLTAISGTALLTCQSNRFVDNSSNNAAVTVTGTPSVQAFSPFLPTTAYDAAVVGGSGYFDGTGDYLVAPNNAVFDFGSGDFTIEFWVYSNGDNEYMPVEKTVNGQYGSWYMQVTSGSLKWNCSSTGSSNDMFNNVNVGTVPTYAWTHIAIVRNGTTFTGYINGVGTSLGTNSSAIYNSSYGITVGAHNGTSSYDLNGYIAGLRLIKGTAAYTSNFTPPTAPPTAITNTSLLLNFTNAGIFDSAAKNVAETVGTAQVSTTQAKWGTTSMYFAGSGNYLLTPYSPNLVFGTADFTFECQLYWTGGNSENNLIMNNASGGFNVKLQAATATNWALENAYVGQVADFGTAPTQNTWHHIAITRASGTLYAFIDGTQVFSGANSTNFTNTASWYVAGNGASLSLYITGYIDDLRITKGYARYTASFTPPAAAFPLL